MVIFCYYLMFIGLLFSIHWSSRQEMHWEIHSLLVFEATLHWQRKEKGFWHRCFGHIIATWKDFRPWRCVSLYRQKKGRFVVVLSARLRMQSRRRGTDSLINYATVPLRPFPRQPFCEHVRQHSCCSTFLWHRLFFFTSTQKLPSAQDSSFASLQMVLTTQAPDSRLYPLTHVLQFLSPGPRHS